jgi:hypothetical protein
MKTFHQAVALCSAALVSTYVEAFAPHQPHFRPASSLDAIGKRREVFGWLKKAAILGFGVKTSSLFQDEKAVNALEEAVNGRIVTFQVKNLGGEDGKAGTFKIQMAPTWAPRGAARFEVRYALAHRVKLSPSSFENPFKYIAVQQRLIMTRDKS